MLTNPEELALNPSICYSSLPQNVYICVSIALFDLCCHYYSYLKFQNKKLPQKEMKINFLLKHQNWLLAIILNISISL